MYAYPGNMLIRTCEEHLRLNPGFIGKMFRLEDIKCESQILKNGSKRKGEKCGANKPYYLANDPLKIPLFCSLHPHNINALVLKGIVKRHKKYTLEEFEKKYGTNLHSPKFKAYKTPPLIKN